MKGDGQRFHRLQAVTDAALAYRRDHSTALLNRIRALVGADTCAVLLLYHPGHGGDCFELILPRS